QIDFTQAQAGKRVARGALKLARREMRRPDFGGDKHVAALDAGGMQSLAHFALVVVHLRGVDMPVTKPQCRLDHAGAGAPAQIPGAKPKERNLGAVRRDARCWSNRAHVGPQHRRSLLAMPALGTRGWYAASALPRFGEHG